MNDLVEFLRARIAEDEQVAKEAAGHAASAVASVASKEGIWDGPYDGTHWTNDYDHVFATDSRPEQPRIVEIADCGYGAFTLTPHIARHDPARVLREVEAKRRVVDAYAEALRIQDGFRETSGETMQREALEMACCAFAVSHANHPDYREEWRP